MLTLYLTCLVVGGVFVGLSAAGAVGKDVDMDLDADVDADVDADADADADADHALDAGHALDGGHGLDPGHALTVADASQGLAPRGADTRKRWLPFLSFRFWTYGAAFFGLTGTLLSTLTAASVVVVALTSAGTGIGVGTVSAGIVRWLRRPVGASIRIADYTGRVAELVMPLRAGGVTRIRLKVQERERTMLAVTAEPLALAAGTRVLVLGIDEAGRAQIEPEQSLYETEK